jgi:predicted nucleic acid-binding protein
MELIQGCKNRAEQDRLQNTLALYGIVWLSSADCDQALDTFKQYHLSHNAGLLDVLIGQTAVALGVPLHTFNQRHYQFIPKVQTTQPYNKTS